MDIDIEDLKRPEAEYKYLRQRMRANIALGVITLIMATYGLVENKTGQTVMMIIGLFYGLVFLYATTLSHTLGKSMKKEDVKHRNYSDEYLNHIHHRAYKHAFDLTVIVLPLLWYFSMKDSFIFSTSSCLLLVFSALALGYGGSVFNSLRKEK